MDSNELLRRQIERRLSTWSQVERQRPRKGWLFIIRQALGMSTAQLAARLGISRQGVADLERRELEDSVTLAALRKTAEAMQCELVYAIIPKTSLVKTLEDQARGKATAEVGRVAHTMRLENQATGKGETEQLIQERMAALLGGRRKQLWEDPASIYQPRRDARGSGN